MKEKTILIDFPLRQPMNELFALMSIDEKGNEGIVSMDGKPLVFGEMGNLQMALENISSIARQCQKRLRLCRFVRSEVMKESE